MAIDPDDLAEILLTAASTQGRLIVMLTGGDRLDGTVVRLSKGRVELRPMVRPHSGAATMSVPLSMVEDAALFNPADESAEPVELDADLREVANQLGVRFDQVRENTRTYGEAGTAALAAVERLRGKLTHQDLTCPKCGEVAEQHYSDGACRGPR